MQLQHFAEVSDGGGAWVGTRNIEKDKGLNATQTIGWGTADMTGLAAIVG